MDQMRWSHVLYMLMFITFVNTNEALSDAELSDKSLPIEGAICNGNTIITLSSVHSGNGGISMIDSRTGTKTATVDIELTNIPDGDNSYDQGVIFQGVAIDSASEFIFILIQRISDSRLPQTLAKINKNDIFILMTETGIIDGEIVHELDLNFSDITFQCIADNDSKLIGIRRVKDDDIFTEIYKIRSVHMKRCQVNDARAGESCSISFRFIKRKEIVDRIMIRKGMVAVSDENNKPKPVWGFTATILVLHHEPP